MAVSTTLSYTDVDHLYLDPMNPRLGRHRVSRETPQNELLSILREWVLDELALSYLESGGFWSYEPLIVVKESLYNDKHLVVVEGNRRLAALKALRLTFDGQPPSKKWSPMLQDFSVPGGLFEQVPYILADSRTDIRAFLGFRHVTGIKRWNADEKASFIAHLIDEQAMSYEEVAQKIGNQIPTVRSNYISYRVLLQMEETIDNFENKRAYKRFISLRMTLGTEGAKQYLQIDETAELAAAKHPVPQGRLENLSHFYHWLFGTSQTPNIFTDTQQAADFGKILESSEAIEYLETAKQPKFEIALRISGGDEEETLRYIYEAINNVELSLMRAHAFKNSRDMQKAVARLGADTIQLISPFSAIRKQLFEESN